MRIALVADINPLNKKGLTNYVRIKAHHLKKLQKRGIFVDFYIVNIIPTLFYAKLHHIKANVITADKDGYVDADGIKYKILTIKRNILHAIYEYLTKKAADYSCQMKNAAKQLKDYDVITSHWIGAHYLALRVNQTFGVPYVTTWHGSDINVFPFEKPGRKQKIADIFSHALMNFFVSKALMQRADEIHPEGKKTHIYTGASEEFYCYSDEKKMELRKKYDVVGKKVIAFSGNVIPIKNVLSLPGIFKRVYQVIGNKAIFWIIGNGNQRKQLEEGLEANNIPHRMFGNVLPDLMPDLMNCIDVLVAPSLNEGIPLVLQEVVACGGFGIGSKVGGIPEVIGEENVFPLGDNFESKISARIIEVLQNDECMKPLPAEYSWTSAIEKELDIFKNAII